MGGKHSLPYSLSELDLATVPLDELTGLTALQKIAIQQSWRSLNADEWGQGQRIFLTFLKEHPDYKHNYTFLNVTGEQRLTDFAVIQGVERHNTRFMKALNSLIEIAVMPVSVTWKREITKMARIYWDLNHTGKDFLAFAETYLGYLSKNYPEELTLYARKSWYHLFGILCLELNKRLKMMYDKKKKKKKQKKKRTWGKNSYYRIDSSEGSHSDQESASSSQEDSEYEGSEYEGSEYGGLGYGPLKQASLAQGGSKQVKRSGKTECFLQLSTKQNDTTQPSASPSGLDRHDNGKLTVMESNDLIDLSEPTDMKNEELLIFGEFHTKKNIAQDNCYATNVLKPERIWNDACLSSPQQQTSRDPDPRRLSISKRRSANTQCTSNDLQSIFVRPQSSNVTQRPTTDALSVKPSEHSFSRRKAGLPFTGNARRVNAPALSDIIENSGHEISCLHNSREASLPETTVPIRPASKLTPFQETPTDITTKIAQQTNALAMLPKASHTKFTSYTSLSPGESVMSDVGQRNKLELKSAISIISDGEGHMKDFHQWASSRMTPETRLDAQPGLYENANNDERVAFEALMEPEMIMEVEKVDNSPRARRRQWKSFTEQAMLMGGQNGLPVGGDGRKECVADEFVQE